MSVQTLLTPDEAEEFVRSSRTTWKVSATPSLQRHVLAMCDGWEACKLAFLVEDADTTACQARLLEVGGSAELWIFARDIAGADVEALHARAQAQCFEGLDGPRRAEFDALLAAYRAQRQQQVAGHQAEVGVADDAGVAPDAPAA